MFEWTPFVLAIVEYHQLKNKIGRLTPGLHPTKIVGIAYAHNKSLVEAAKMNQGKHKFINEEKLLELDTELSALRDLITSRQIANLLKQ